MLEKLLARTIIILFNIYINMKLKQIPERGDKIMKCVCSVKGFKLDFTVKDKVQLTDGQIAVVDIMSTTMALDESSSDVEMSDEEFKHTYTTIKEDLANLREVVLVPLMDKVFASADKLAETLDKKVQSDIKCAEMRCEAGIKERASI